MYIFVKHGLSKHRCRFVLSPHSEKVLYLSFLVGVCSLPSICIGQVLKFITTAEPCEVNV